MSYTLLMRAAAQFDVEDVRRVFQKYPNSLFEKDAKGRTALDWAR